MGGHWTTHTLFDIWNPGKQIQTPIPLSLEFWGQFAGELDTHLLLMRIKGYGHEQVSPFPIVAGGHSWQ